MRVPFLFIGLLASMAAALQPARATEGGGEKPIVNLASADAARHFVPTGGPATASAHDGTPAAVVVTIQPGPSAFPGVEVKPEQGNFDFSAAGHVEARIANLDKEPLTFNVRLDNASPLGTFWISETVKIAPGETKPVRVYLSKPVNGFNPAEITRVLFFTGKVEGAPRSFRIESLVTAGPPGEQPPGNAADVRVKPDNGVLFGAQTAVDPSRQLTVKGGAAAVTQNHQLQISLPAAAGTTAAAAFKPAEGCWDLRDALEVRVTMKNTGSVPVTPQLHLDSTYGPTDTVSAPAPIQPGQEAEIVVPFQALKPWTHTPQQENAPAAGPSGGTQELQGPMALRKNAEKWGPAAGTGNTFLSNSVKAVECAILPAGQDRAVAITSIKAGLPPVPVLPDWLGKRPPVAGDWIRTFDDEFDGTTLDATKWNVTGGQFYDKTSHYTKDDVIVGGGNVRLRYEKKTGYHNDDPKQYQTDYATGYLDTADKWRQRYGYFESRLKLPELPGFWAAFWMMPNRPGTDRFWARARTTDDAMEFDILEWLSIWGPYRHNIAMHWDGYKEDHKSAGSKIFFQPDKDGFVTTGLLWTPGSAVYYANGKETLRFESARVSSVPSNLIFDLVTGGWDNNHFDPAHARLPVDLIVDYVRCWQRRDLASDADTTRVAPK